MKKIRTKPRGKGISLPQSKILNTMKNILLLIVLSTLQLIGANDTYAQKTLLSLEMEDVPVERVLEEIENQSEFFFLYNSKLVDVKRKVDVRVSKQKIKKTLSTLFSDTKIQFMLMGRQIILTPDDESVLTKRKKDQRTSLEFSSLGTAMEDKATVTGTVTDAGGQPLIGATIMVKGSGRGTITDVDGKFSLETNDDDQILVISYTGYEPQEVQISGRSVIDVVMLDDIASLDEVVVIGYGTQRKTDVTGSLVRVNTEKQADVPNTNILQLIKGNVAGVTIGTPDRPGEEPNFRIRGTNSISAGNGPLIVIDGIIYSGSLNNININDIESVDILKDASATAVYGSRSANGVVLITTKKGTSEKPEFSFSGRYGVSDPVSLIPVLNGEQYQQKILDFRAATGQEANPANISDYLTITEANNLAAGKTIDWYDRLVQQSVTQDFTASVSGRTDKTSYYLSGSVFDQAGIIENDNFQRTSALANFSNKITDWFTLSLRTSFTHLDYSGAAVPLAYALSPYSNWFEDGADSGELEYFPMEDPFFRHPLLNLNIDDHDKRTDLRGILSTIVKVPFVKGLKWTMNYSRNQRTNRRYIFNDNTLAITANGDASKTITDFNTWTFDNIVNYDRAFNNVHSLGATFLYSREYQSTGVTQAQASNFFSQSLGYNSLELGGVPSVATGFGEQNQNAIMGRINYSYDDKYSITGTIRRDGFSGFADGNKYATFYSGALSWVLTNEGFLQDIAGLDRLKLRLSYGQNGNQAIGSYQTLARLASRNYVFGDGGGTSNGAYVNSIANNSLGWETTKVVNLGLDFALFKSRLSGSIDIYDSNTEDLLLRRSIPSLTGFNSVFTNIGKVNNRGFELALNASAINQNDLRWDIGFVLDLNRNKIQNLFGVDDDGDGIEDDDIANRWFIGQPLGVFFGYGVDGIHQLNESDIPAGYEPGDFRIIDHDGDGDLTPADRYILGNNQANYQFSISTTLEYKNWSLFVMVNSIQGGGNNNYYMGNNIHGHNPNAPFASWTERFSFPAMNYWTPTNPSNTASRINYQPARGHPFLEDRSFIRIQDIILSYSFDQNLINKWNIAGLRLFVSGKNLYTFTNWTGYDPENATTITSGPMLRTLTTGLDLRF